jgi:hypothetical protein
MNKRKSILFVVLGLLALGLVIFMLPPIQERFWYHFDQLRIRVFYALKPPEKAVFTPQPTAIAAVVNATMTALSAQVSPTPTLNPTATNTPLPPDIPTPTATFTPTPLPASFVIPNVPYVDQHYGFNNCAPATLTMALKFWGFQGTREGVASYLKPFAKDKNVMPYELTDFVNGMTDYRALDRVGGTLDLLKRMVAGGYPVMIESGVYLRDISGKVSWMGHYQYVYGYDDAAAKFQVKDAYEANGDKFTVTYDDLVKSWRAFNDAFIVVYPPDQEGAVLALLSDYADSSTADRIAYDTASVELNQLEGQDQFFAWFNRGSSMVRLGDYNGAAAAYDQAFALYANLPADKRPWRIVWYETGPYFAYFNTGRYQDVISLADQTISSASEPYLEESFYWRARAKAVTGDTKGAIEDLNKSLEYHPDFAPSTALLAQLGGTQ